jgi:magnesium chelatase family protein
MVEVRGELDYREWDDEQGGRRSELQLRVFDLQPESGPRSARRSPTTTVGIAAYQVRVEVDLARGLPSLRLLGLDDAAALQARDRLRAAFANTGYHWPDQRVTVSLSPASLPKHGAGVDLPIAAGVLAASGQVPAASVVDMWAVGELGLDGDLRPVPGVLAAALAARQGRRPRAAGSPRELG